jgi:hypothetical protein
LSEEADALLADMADYWNVSTERFFHSYALLARFIREQVALGELAFVSSQFYAYKSARNVQPHNLDNFLGKPGEWLGAWNKEDYSKKLTKRQAQDPNAQGDGKQSHLGQRLTSGNAAAQRLLDKRNARLQTQNEA